MRPRSEPALRLLNAVAKGPEEVKSVVDVMRAEMRDQIAEMIALIEDAIDAEWNPLVGQAADASRTQARNEMRGKLGRLVRYKRQSALAGGGMIVDPKGQWVHVGDLGRIFGVWPDYDLDPPDLEPRA